MRPTSEILTFYSHKGGVGRSQALANVGVALANRGRSVLLVDMDLEAPGLHQFFHAPGDKGRGSGERLRDRDLGDGVLDWFTAASSLPEVEPRFPQPQHLAHPSCTRGALHLLPAGRMDEGYAKRLSALSWSTLYRDRQGFALVERFREHLLAFGADVVLIDARTGLTDISNVATFQLPDRVVLLFTLHLQGIEGTARMARALQRARDRDWLDCRLKEVYLLASRVSEGESEERRRDWENRAAGELHGLGVVWVEHGVRIPHDGDAAFGENIVVSPLGASGHLSQAYETLADRLFGDPIASTVDARERMLDLADGLVVEMEAAIKGLAVVHAESNPRLIDLEGWARRAAPGGLGGAQRRWAGALREATGRDAPIDGRPSTLNEWTRTVEFLRRRTDDAVEARRDEMLAVAKRELTEAAGSETPVGTALERLSEHARPGAWSSFREQLACEVKRLQDRPEDRLARGLLTHADLAGWLGDARERQRWLDDRLRSELEGETRLGSIANALELRAFGRDDIPTPSHWLAYEWLVENGWEPDSRFERLGAKLWLAEWQARLRDGMASTAPNGPWNEFLAEPGHLRSVGEAVGTSALLGALEDTPVATSLFGDPASARALATWIPGLVTAIEPARRLRVLARSGLSASGERWWVDPLVDAARLAGFPRAALEVWAADTAYAGRSARLPAGLAGPAAAAIGGARSGDWQLHPDLLHALWALPDGRRDVAALLLGDAASTPDARAAIGEAGLPPASAAFGAAWRKFEAHAGSDGVDRLRALRELQREWSGGDQNWTPAVEAFSTSWAPSLFYQADLQRYWQSQVEHSLNTTAPVHVEVERIKALDFKDWLHDALKHRDASRTGGSDPYPSVQHKMEQAFAEKQRQLGEVATLRADAESLVELLKRGATLRAAEEDLDDADAENEAGTGWISMHRPSPGELDPWVVRTLEAAQFVQDALGIWCGQRSEREAFAEALSGDDLRCAAELVRGDPLRSAALLDRWAQRVATLDGALGPAQHRLAALGTAVETPARTSAMHAITDAAQALAGLRVESAEELLGKLRTADRLLNDALDSVELAEMAIVEAEEDHRRRTDAQHDALRKIKRHADDVLDEALFQVDRRRLEQVRYAHGRVLDAVAARDAGGAARAGRDLDAVVSGQLDLELPRVGAAPAPAPAPSPRAARGPRPTPSRLADLVQQELEATIVPGPHPVPTFSAPWDVWSSALLKPYREALASAAHLSASGERLHWLIATGRIHLLNGDHERGALAWRDALKLAVAFDIEGPKLDQIVSSMAVCAALPALPADERDAASSARNLERLCHPSRRSLVAERVDRLDVWELIADAAIFAGSAGAGEFYDRWIGPALAEHPVAREPLARRAAATIPEAEEGCVGLLGALFPTLLPALRASVLDGAARPSRPPGVEATIQAVRAGLRNLSEDPAAEAALDALLQPGEPSSGLTSKAISIHLLTSEVVATTNARAVLRINTPSRLALRGLQVEVGYTQQGGRRLPRTFQRPAAVPFIRGGGWAEVVLPLVTLPAEAVDGTLEARLASRGPGGQLIDVETSTKNHRLSLLMPPDVPPQLNPYAAGRPIPKEAQLFGRADEIEAVLQRLLGTHDTNVVLVQGERRMGKTSLLTAACQHPKLTQAFSQVVWLDLQGIADKETPANFWKYRFIEPLSRRLEAEGLTAPTVLDDALRDSPGRAAADFARAVDRLLVRGERKPFLFVVDELERLLVVIDGRQALGEDTLASLREIIQSNRHLAFLMAGVSDVLSRHTRTAAHRLYGLALDVALGPLPTAAATELAEKPAAGSYTLVPAARELLLAETGRHPYLLQFVLHRLYTRATRRQLRTVTVTDVEELVSDEVVKQPIAFANYLDALPDPGELQLLHAVAAVQRGERSVLVREVVDRLQRWGQAVEESGTRARMEEIAQRAPAVLTRLLNGRFRIPVGLFARYLRDQRRGGSTLVLAD